MRAQPVVEETDDADASNRGIDGEIGRGADAHEQRPSGLEESKACKKKRVSVKRGVSFRVSPHLVHVLPRSSPAMRYHFLFARQDRK